MFVHSAAVNKQVVDGLLSRTITLLKSLHMIVLVGTKENDVYIRLYESLRMTVLVGTEDEDVSDVRRVSFCV